MSTKPKQRSRKKKQVNNTGTSKGIFWILGGGAAVALGLLGINYVQAKNATRDFDNHQSDTGNDSEGNPGNGGSDGGRKPTQSKGDSFPLSRGSRGPRVKKLQQALIDKYGRSILPKWGADGSWGRETQSGLISKGLPTIINEATFNSIIPGSTSQLPADSRASIIDAKTLATMLWQGANNHDLFKILATLKKLKTVADYSIINSYFEQWPLKSLGQSRKVNQTMVNGLLRAFSDEGAKEQIRKEFKRIGLKYNGKVWSLSGLGSMGRQLITKRNAGVWDGRQLTEVPAKIILGREIHSQNGLTEFETLDNQRFLIRTNAVQYV